MSEKNLNKNPDNTVIDNSEGNLNLDEISAINQEFKPDPWYVTLGFGIAKLLKSLGLWIWDFLLSIFKSIIGLFVGSYKGIIRFGKWCRAFAIRQKEYFEESDTSGKISYGIMGASYIKHKQYIKGILFLVIEIAFIVFMILSGARNISKLITLGDTPFQEGVWDDELGGFTEPTQGDNSVKCMLFGVLTVIVIIFFVILYFKNIKGANDNCHIAYNIKYHKAYDNALYTIENRQKELIELCSVDGKFVDRKQIRKIAQEKMGMNSFDALILSRVNFEMIEKGYSEGAIEEMKLIASKHSHSFDKYNTYYEHIQLLEDEIKSYKVHSKLKELIDQCIDKKGNHDKKEAICQIVNEVGATGDNAKILYKEFMDTKDADSTTINQLIEEKEKELKEYIVGHPERMDSKFYSAKREAMTYLDEKFSLTIMVLPTIMCCVMIILPLMFTTLIAFTEYDGNHNYPNLFTWSGLENLSHLFVSDGSATGKIANTVWTLLGWTIIWAIFATFLNYIFGMVLALLINKKGIKLKKLWRTFFVLTIAIPSFISLTCMGKLLGDQGAVVQTIYRLTGNKIHFLSDYNLTVTKIMIIVIDLWIGIPYTMLMTSGILMNIPEDLYESAKIDGAGPFVQFFKITLPYMLFVTGPSLITQFVGNINNFNVIFFLTGGITTDISLYKAKQTDLLITWLYTLATGADQKYNIAAVIGIFIFVVCAFFSLIFYSKTSAVNNEEDFQ